MNNLRSFGLLGAVLTEEALRAFSFGRLSALEELKFAYVSFDEVRDAQVSEHMLRGLLRLRRFHLTGRGNLNCVSFGRAQLPELRELVLEAQELEGNRSTSEDIFRLLRSSPSLEILVLVGMFPLV